MAINVHQSADSGIPAPRLESTLPRPRSESSLTDLSLESFIPLVSSSSESMRAESIEKIQEKSWWYAADGSGPTLLGNISRLTQTASYIGQDALRRFAHSPSVSPDHAILDNQATRLTSTILINFLNAIKPTSPTPFEFSPFLCTTTVHNLSWDDLTKHLQGLYNQYDKETAAETSWVIPLVLQKKFSFEYNHIVVIIVRNNELIFFDPKGIISENYPFDESRTIKDIVNLCSQIFRPGKEVKRIENKKVCQWDCNNCGVYVAIFTYHMLVFGHSLKEFYTEIDSQRDTKRYREFIKGCISTIEEPESNRATSSQLLDLDFDEGGELF